MKHVTVYDLKETKIVVHDSEKTIKRVSIRDIGIIHNSPGEYVNKAECAYKEVHLPIQRYCTVGKEDIYIAFDHEVMKLLGIHEDKVSRMLEKKAKEITLLENELSAFKDMSIWQALKFTGNKFLHNILEKK